jgi:hypothetical protein
MTKDTVRLVNLSGIGLGLRRGWNGQETQHPCQSEAQNKRSHAFS